MCLCCKYLILVVSSWNFVYSSICLERANCCDLGRAGVGARVKLWALSGGPAGVCSSQRSCQHCFRVSIRSVGHCLEVGPVWQKLYSNKATTKKNDSEIS